MDELINELDKCVKNELYISAVNLALVVPDICSALQSSNGRTSGKKYANWFNKYMGSETYGSTLGSEIYKLRCASLHQGKFNNDYDGVYVDRIMFILPNRKKVIIHGGGTIENVMCLYLVTFVNDIIESYWKWKEDMKYNVFYINNRKHSFHYRPLGLFPVQGIPVLG